MNNILSVEDALLNREKAREAKRAKAWARANFRSFQMIDPSWSQAIQDECHRINQEVGSFTRTIEED